MCAADHKSRQINGSFLREKPGISGATPTFKIPSKPSALAMTSAGFVKLWQTLGRRPLPKAHLGLGVHQLRNAVLRALGGTRTRACRLTPKVGNPNGMWTSKGDERAGRQSDRGLASNADRNRSGAKGSKRSATGIAARTSCAFGSSEGPAAIICSMRLVHGGLRRRGPARRRSLPPVCG